jgi:hypothetical protein
MVRFASATSIILALAACTGAASTGLTTQDVACPPDSTLSYESFGRAVIADNCLECHASDERPTLNDLASVQVNRAQILQAAVFTDEMPEDSDMELADRQLLGEWLSCGAP